MGLNETKGGARTVGVIVPMGPNETKSGARTVDVIVPMGLNESPGTKIAAGTPRLVSAPERRPTWRS